MLGSHFSSYTNSLASSFDQLSDTNSLASSFDQRSETNNNDGSTCALVSGRRAKAKAIAKGMVPGKNSMIEAAILTCIAVGGLIAIFGAICLAGTLASTANPVLGTIAETTTQMAHGLNMSSIGFCEFMLITGGTLFIGGCIAKAARSYSKRVLKKELVALQARAQGMGRERFSRDSFLSTAQISVLSRKELIQAKHALQNKLTIVELKDEIRDLRRAVESMSSNPVACHPLTDMSLEALQELKTNLQHRCLNDLADVLYRPFEDDLDLSVEQKINILKHRERQILAKRNHDLACDLVLNIIDATEGVDAVTKDDSYNSFCFRESMEALAHALGIDFDRNTTDRQLHEALVQSNAGVAALKDYPYHRFMNHFSALPNNEEADFINDPENACTLTMWELEPRSLADYESQRTKKIFTPMHGTLIATSAVLRELDDDVTSVSSRHSSRGLLSNTNDEGGSIDALLVDYSEAMFYNPFNEEMFANHLHRLEDHLGLNRTDASELEEWDSEMAKRYYNALVDQALPESQKKDHWSVGSESDGPWQWSDDPSIDDDIRDVDLAGGTASGAVLDEDQVHLLAEQKQTLIQMREKRIRLTKNKKLVDKGDDPLLPFNEDSLKDLNINQCNDLIEQEMKALMALNKSNDGSEGSDDG